jgi:hypothetical protein
LMVSFGIILEPGAKLSGVAGGVDFL